MSSRTPVRGISLSLSTQGTVLAAQVTEKLGDVSAEWCGSNWLFVIRLACVALAGRLSFVDARCHGRGDAAMTSFC